MPGGGVTVKVKGISDGSRGRSDWTWKPSATVTRSATGTVAPARTGSGRAAAVTVRCDCTGRDCATPAAAAPARRIAVRIGRWLVIYFDVLRRLVLRRLATSGNAETRIYRVRRRASTSRPARAEEPRSSLRNGRRGAPGRPELDHNDPRTPGCLPAHRPNEL